VHRRLTNVSKDTMTKETLMALARDAGMTAAHAEIRSTRLRTTNQKPALRSGIDRSTRSFADQATAEEGVYRAYRAAGLAPPEIVWCESPVQAASVWAASGERAGPPVKELIVERPYRACVDRITRLSRDRILGSHHLPARDPGDAVNTAISTAVLDTVGDIRPPLLSWVFRRMRRRSLQPIWRPTFAAHSCGPGELNSVGRIASVEAAFVGTSSDALMALRQINENSGWLLPHERICWLSAHPDVAYSDVEGRLHCPSGPALAYRDGWKYYAWKGVAVPAWVILRPEEITLDWIDAQIDGSVRNAMIEIMTVERFIAAGGAEPIANDGSGTLWRRIWTYRGTVIDTWSAVEYSRSSPKRIFATVPAHIRSPKDALHWLFGPPKRVSSGAK